MARLCPLFSGSRGNSYYVGSRSAGVLVDAGRSARQLDNMLKSCSIEPMAIQGILITHEHSDHVSGARVFAKKYQIPVFASRGTIMALGEKLEGVKTYVIQEDLNIADMQIHPFSTPHDCAEPLGYRIHTHDKRVITIATDMGYLPDKVREGILGSDFVVLESNHDEEMLKNGEYPYSLKRRILSQHGHLSNDLCAEFIVELARNKTRRFLLAHLSDENNTHALAMRVSKSALERAGFVDGEDFILDVALPENTQGKSIVF